MARRHTFLEARFGTRALAFLLSFLSLPLVLVACDQSPSETEAALQSNAGAAAAAMPAGKTALRHRGQGASPRRAKRTPNPIEDSRPPEPPSEPDPFPTTGLALHFYSPIYRETKRSDHHQGYLRRGSRVRLRSVGRNRGCRDGWYELATGGFVCAGAALAIVDEDGAEQPPPELENKMLEPASLADPLPYRYKYTVRRDVPQYKELPSASTEAKVIDALKERRAWKMAIEEQVDDEGSPQPMPEDTDESPEPHKTESAEAAEDCVETEQTPCEDPGPPLPEELRQAMDRGFYVSVAGEETSVSGRTFVRTTRGAYVRSDDLIDNSPPESQGIVLGDNWPLPLATVFRRGTKGYRRDAITNRIGDRHEVPRHAVYKIEDTHFEHKGRRYILASDGTLVRDSAVRIVQPVDRPQAVRESDKWIHVDLAQQTLTAYEGDTPVYATVVSTGKEGFETPTGLFNIQSKHVSTTMDDFASPEGAYSIEDVPWTMYFHGNYAIHGAFWHYTFGRVRSHGCVNVSPPDAHWLFFWATPDVPEGWHGIYSDRKHPGTFVYVTE